MALKESLEKFKKQQEKNQSLLSSISSSRQPRKTSVDNGLLSSSASVRTPAPVGAQMKRVIDLLFETRAALTPEQINEACCVDMYSNKAVFDSLAKNPKVYYDGRRFSYKSKHDLKDKDQLLYLIRKFPEGIAVVDIQDAYPTVMEDLQDLKAAGQIWLLSNIYSKEDIAYPSDPKVPINVDDDIKKLFHEIELPLDMLDIEEDLQKNGMKPATDTAKRRAAAQIQGISSSMDKPKKKERQISKRTKLTNAHLPELFQNPNNS